MLYSDDSLHKTLLICSGGLDSVCLAYYLAQRGKLKSVISFDYGQRHKKEIFFARLCAERLNAPFSCIDLSSIGAELTGSALTDSRVTVPEGHYTEENMRQTIVPNRNVIFLAAALAAAAAKSLDSVAIAVHGGDHFIYPDCRPQFLNLFNAMEKEALGGTVQLLAPYAEKTKADIVAAAALLQTPFAETWSCYKGGDNHCGRCGTCVERREAFHLAGVKDPTIYEDNEFWQNYLQ